MAALTLELGFAIRVGISYRMWAYSVVSTLSVPIGVVRDALSKFFEILSTALQGGCFYYQLIVESTEAQRGIGVPQGCRHDVVGRLRIQAQSV